MRRLLSRAVLAVAMVIAAALPVRAEIPSAQKFVDEAKAGDTVQIPPGTYKGPLVIDKAITVDGGGKVTIDNGNEGTVVLIDTDGATVRGLHLINSGDQHNDIDAGVQVRGNFNVVRNNVIENTLFGIDLEQSHNNVVRHNRIIGKDFHLGVRGDAIRLWYSRNNRIEENEVTRSRDLVVWYSADNVFRANKVSGGRYALHFMYAQYNLVTDNDFVGNSVGIFLMYSDSVVVRRNHIARAQGATGMGIGMKETSDVVIEDNDVIYCATGMYFDVSPFQPETTNRVRRNRIAFNGVGVLFHNDWTGNVLHDNRFEDNFEQVSVNAQASAARNEWDGNYWDDYRGFDRDGDGIGDHPYKKRVYADRLWMDVRYAAFYKGSPVMSLLDFLERLAPFTEPILLLSDGRPKMSPEVQVARKDEGEATPATLVDEEDGGRIDPFGLKDRLGK